MNREKTLPRIGILDLPILPAVSRVENGSFPTGGPTLLRVGERNGPPTVHVDRSPLSNPTGILRHQRFDP
jgi:hypothetical protein